MFKDCPSPPGPDGFIHGCPRCDGEDHLPKNCPQGTWKERQVRHYFLQSRVNKPPMVWDRDLRHFRPDDPWRPWPVEFSKAMREFYGSGPGHWAHRDISTVEDHVLDAFRGEISKFGQQISPIITGQPMSDRTTGRLEIPTMTPRYNSMQPRLGPNKLSRQAITPGTSIKRTARQAGLNNESVRYRGGIMASYGSSGKSKRYS